MRGIIHQTENRKIWLHKSFDIKHGFGWFCQVYGKDFKIGFGFNKNKFTSVRNAFKDLGETF